MALTNDLCELHKRHIGIYSGMNSKRYADIIEWSEHKKQTNAIHFECGRYNIERALIYFKHTYPTKMTVAQAEKSLGYNCFFISMVGSFVSRLDPSISIVCHVKMQAVITDHLISKRWGRFTQTIFNMTLLKSR